MFYTIKGYWKLIFFTAILFCASTSAYSKIIKWKVGEVSFEGNKTFSRKEILSLMETKPKLLPFQSVRFTESKLRSDIKEIRSLYHSRGFISVEIEKEEVTRDTSSKKVSITIGIEEGPRTYVTSVEMITERELLDSVTLSSLKTKPGKPLIVPHVRKDARVIEDSLAQRGFIKASVEPDISIDSSDFRAMVKFRISEGPLVEVGHYSLKGLETLRPVMVKRELAFTYGDTLTKKAIRLSERRLYRTGLFSFIHIVPQVGDSTQTVADLPDGVYPVQIEVDEADFFHIQTGVGYGTDEGFRTSLTSSYRNLWYLGHRITARGKASQKFQSVEGIYSTPWLYLLPLQFDGSVYFNRYDDEEKLRGIFNGVRLSIGQQTDYNIAYQTWVQWEREEWATRIANTDEAPKSITRSIGFGVTYDARDDLFNPTKGIYNKLNTEVAGLIGAANSNRFTKIDNDIRFYWDLGSSIYLSSAVRAGWVWPYADGSVPGPKLYYSGGARSVRGFKEDHLITAIDSTKGVDPVGGSGKALLVLNVFDLQFPLFWWINGAVFLDGGYIWQSFDDIGGVTKAFQDLRWTAGPGIRVKTPLAVVRFDVGFKLDRREGEPLWMYHIDIGQAF